MESQNNNIDKYFKKISEETKPQNFQGMENVWRKVEEKLDRNEKMKTLPIWKYAGIAASILVIIGLGSLFMKNESPTILQPLEQNIVNNEMDTNPFDDSTKASENELIVYEDIKEKIDVKSSKNINETKKPTIEASKYDVVISKQEIESLSEVVIAESNQEIQNLYSKTIAHITASDNSEITITGTVTDYSGLPLPGVNILIKNTSTGTQTDFDGSFALTVNVGQTLVFSYVGFKSQEITVTAATKTINIAMDWGEELQSVIVTAAGIQREAKSLGYSVSEVTSKSINQPNYNVNVVKALSGKSPGVIINNTNGISRTRTFTRIGGYNSVNDRNQPIYILDGRHLKHEEIKKINPKNIKNINVLKGLAATIPYGSIGRNGVIELTTKEKPKGDQKSVEDSISFENILKMYPPKDQESYENFIENPFEGASYSPVSTFSIDVDNASYTNIRRFINNGQTVPKDAVRIEEMINFFKYDYPHPKSKHPFTINTQYSDAPWNPKHKLLKIGLKGKDIPTDKLPKSNFVFLVDVSGSMSAANKLPLLKSSMKILLDELREDDMVSIVYYANNVGVLLEPTKASEKKKITEVIDKMYASGGTSGGAGLELAYQMAEKNFIKGGNNRIILATDGDFNIGRSSDKEMEKLIEEKRKSGVNLTCLGYGMGNYKDSKMEILANKGNGNYAYIDNIQEANRFLSKEFKGSMFTIAKDVKIQIEFNPNHVLAYRLIGYENRRLKNEDFTNDAIDAGELGSGHSVTAFYEIIPNGVKSEFYENVLDLKYSQNTVKSNEHANELATVKFRYKKPDQKKSIEMVHPITKNPVNFENTSKDFKFASSVAWFGLKLRDSKLISNKESEAILKLAKEGLNNDTDGYKTEFIRLVESHK